MVIKVLSKTKCQKASYLIKNMITIAKKEQFLNLACYLFESGNNQDFN